MSTHRHIDRICVAILLCTILLTVLFLNGEKLGIRVITDQDAKGSADYFSNNDLNGDWEVTSPTKIKLEEKTVSGPGAYFLEDNLVISNLVDAHSYSKVFIRLEGVDITCSEDACLQIHQAEKVFLTLAPDTENSFTGGAVWGKAAISGGRDGVIYAGDDLTINGSGSLTITAPFRHGIEANDDLMITGGHVIIDAALDAINVNDSFRFCEATLTVNGGDDGISVKTAQTGYFYMESGEITVTAGDDGIHSAGNVLLAGGTLNISAEDDGIHADNLITVEDGTLNILHSYRGLEAAEVQVTGGVQNIQYADEAIRETGEAIWTEEETEEAEEETIVEEPVEYTSETWRWAGVSLLVLLIGLTLVKLFRKHG